MSSPPTRTNGHPNADDQDCPLVLEAFANGFKRGFLLVVGLIAIILPTYELRHAFTRIDVLTLFFGVIVLGAWSVGGIFVVGAIVGAHQRWFFDADGVTIERSSLIARRSNRYIGADITRTEIRENTYDTREPTFTVLMFTRDGQEHQTPERSSRAAAERLQRGIDRRLGR